MTRKIDPVEDTPEQAASSISDALDFLREEADAVGMSDVSNLLEEASAKSREHSEVLGSGMPAPRQDSEAASGPTWRRRYLPIGAAAALALAAVLGFLLLPAPDYEATYQTGVGQQLDIRLPDDSMLRLNTDSEVSVRYTGKARRLTLERGEAWFDVTPAPARPFSVDAGSGTVRAVGTEFNVWLENEVVEVTVGEGTVEVRANEAEGFAATTELLTEGQTLTYRDTLGPVEIVDPDEMNRQRAWRDGMLDFHGHTLVEVVEEATRYTALDITIADPELEGLPVIGYVRAGNDEKLIELIEANDGLAVQRIDADEVLIVAEP